MIVASGIIMNHQIHLNLLKIELDSLISDLDSIMKEIQRLDAFISNTENDEETAMLMTGVIMQKAEKFEELTDKVRSKLNVYLEEQKKYNVPVDFSYVRLLNQILKG